MPAISLVLVADSDRHAELRALADRAEIVGVMAEPSALRLVAALRPDIVLLDGAASAINPLTALAWLHALPDAPRVIYLAATPSTAERRLALELGVVAVATPGDKGALRDALGVGRSLTRLGRPLIGGLRAA